MVRDVLRVLPVYCGRGPQCEAALTHLEAMWRSAEAGITADAATRRRHGRPSDTTAPAA
jgi:hypothetical protein